MTKAFIILSVVSALGGQLMAQDFTITETRISAGGGKLSGGDFKLANSVAQMDAGRFGEISSVYLNSGFLTLLLQLPEGPGLSLEIRKDSGMLVFSWPSSDDDYELQFLTQLGVTTNWKRVEAVVNRGASISSVVIPMVAEQAFYRLSKTVKGP